MLLAGALALILRIVYLAGAARSPLFGHPAFDGAGFDTAAWALARGQGSSASTAGHPYTWFLAAIYAAAGHNPLAPRIIQALLDTMSVLLLGATAHAIWGKRAALFAAVVAALYGPLIYFQGEIGPATLSFFLISASLCLTTRAARSGSMRTSGIAALALALVTTLALARAGSAGAGSAGGVPSPLLRIPGNLLLAWNRGEAPCGADPRFIASFNSPMFRFPGLLSVWFVGPIALVAAWCQRRRAPLLALYLAAVTIAIAATRVCDSTRLPLATAAIPFAGFGIDRFVAAFSRGAVTSRVGAAAALAEVACAHGRTLIALGLAAVLVTVPFPRLGRTRSGEGWATVAQAYERAGDPLAAQRAYAEAERSGLKSADLYADWGALEQKERLGIGAEQHLLTAINLDTRHAAAHETLGDVYFDRGSYDQASRQYAIAAGLIPERAAEFYTRAGEACEEKQDRERAAAMFQRALGARPGYRPAERGLVRLRAPEIPEQRVKMFPPLNGSPNSVDGSSNPPSAR